MQQKHKTQIPLNPLNFSPIGIDCRNGKKNLESQYNMSSSIKVMAIPFMKTRGNQTILSIQRLQKGWNHSKHLHKGEKQSKRSKARVLNKMEKLPNVHAQRSAQIWYPCSPKII